MTGKTLDETLEQQVHDYLSAVVIPALAGIAATVDPSYRAADALVEMWDAMSGHVTSPLLMRHHQKVAEIAKSVTATVGWSAGVQH